ncbi:MAG: hypothetical protein R2787_09635 [Saprospiraceae bacterium]
MNKLIYILLALILPLGVAVWAMYLKELSQPWWLLIPIAVFVTLSILPLVRYLRRIPALEDRSLSVFLGVVYLLIPAGALALLLNRMVAIDSHVDHLEVMDRFPDQPNGDPDTWVFLWTGQDILRIKVSPDDPLYLCQPRDTVSLQYATGLLGLEYLEHADRR